MALTFRPTQPLDIASVLPSALIEEHLKVDPTGDESTLIAALARAACRWVEARTSTSLAARTWAATFDGFRPIIGLPVGPVQSVTAISYRDPAGLNQQIAGGGWYFDGAAVAPAVGTIWPAGAGVVSVAFTAGFTDVATDAPHLVAAAAMMLVHLWRNREGQAEGAADAPPGVIMLCDLMRTPVTACA